MSAGPIKQERAARKKNSLSTAAATSVHASGNGTRAYCGTSRGARSAPGREVNCADCNAAMRADGIPTPKGPHR